MTQQPRLLIPDYYRHPSGLHLPSSVAATADPTQLPEELRQPAALVAFAHAPSMADNILVYITAADLGLRPWTTDELIARLVALPFETTMRLLSHLQRDLWPVRHSPEGQIGLLERWFPDSSPYRRNAILFMKQKGNGIALSEHQLFALQRLVALHAADPVPNRPLSDADLTSALMSLVMTPDCILERGMALPAAQSGDRELEEWLRFFVANGGLIGANALFYDLGRAHHLYGLLPQSSESVEHHSYCNLDEWLLDAWSLSFEELQAMGVALLAGADMLSVDTPPRMIDPDYFSQTSLGSRAHAGMQAFTAGRAWYVDEFDRQRPDERHQAFGFLPFLMRPGLRLTDGRIALIAPRAVTTWIGAAGAYYRFLDIARERGQLKRFTHFNASLMEQHVFRLAEAAYPGQLLRPPGGGRIHREITYGKRGGQKRSSDVVIDLGLDLVLVEVTSGRPTQGTLVDADPESVRHDIAKLVTAKVQQIARVADDFASGRLTVPGVDYRVVERIWPLVVSSETLFLSPPLWDYIDAKAGAHLRRPKLQPLVILNLEDAERLFGIVTEGHHIVEILRSKTAPTWLMRDFGSWLANPISRIGSGRNHLVEEWANQAYDGCVDLLRPDNG